MANNLDSLFTTTTLKLIVESFFFGLYSALFIFSTIVLYKRPPSRMRRAMLTLSVVMYAVSAAHWALQITFDVTILKSRPPFNMVSFFASYLPIFNYILSDGIVLWRAWVLWNGRFLLFIPALICLVCTLGLTVASAMYFLLESNQVVNYYKELAIIGRSLDFSIFGTNLWATGLIFFRAWQHRRFLRSLCLKGTCRSNTEKTLAFLVESGALYLCIWIVHISTSIAGNLFWMALFGSALVQITAMYPTMIIIVVTMQLSTADHIVSLQVSGADAHRDSPIVFTPASPGLVQSQVVGDVQTSPDGRFIAVSSDATSTGVVTLSEP